MESVRECVSMRACLCSVNFIEKRYPEDKNKKRSIPETPITREIGASNRSNMNLKSHY